jgi:hypothetical protein
MKTTGTTPSQSTQLALTQPVQVFGTMRGRPAESATPEARAVQATRLI